MKVALNAIQENELTQLMNAQLKYGQRRNESWEQWILRKRSINVACMIIRSIQKYSFDEMESLLFFRYESKISADFQRRYEMQMEEAHLHPDQFIRKLDQFYVSTCLYIEKEKLYREYFDFYVQLELIRDRRAVEGHTELFDAYLSLVMQQTGYFCRSRMQDNVAGLSNSGDLIFRKNPNPFSDAGNYTLERYYPKLLHGKGGISSDIIYKAYQPYGYSFHSLDEVDVLEAKVKVYDNNNHAMIPYIDESSLMLLVDQPYQHHVPEFPREWKQTAYYLDKLQSRNYMLPAAGVTIQLKNAGDIKRVLLKEILYQEEIVLLYHVFTSGNGEYSGYYYTKKQFFFSIFKHTNRPEWHDQIENFILELYMILACDYDIDKKKNYAIRQVESFETEFHYPYQPLMIATYQDDTKKAVKKASATVRNYRKEEYQEELKSLCGYIRRLPVGQRASLEAQQHACNMGYELPVGKTYVRAFHRTYYRAASILLAQEKERVL